MADEIPSQDAIDKIRSCADKLQSDFDAFNAGEPQRGLDLLGEVQDIIKCAEALRANVLGFGPQR